MKFPLWLFALGPGLVLAAEPAGDSPPPERRAPVKDISRAVVYTVNEVILSDAGLELARQADSDVLVRGWFKWYHAPDFARLAPLAAKAHRMGALFGGGVTVSALYEGENGLRPEQVLDMATRGPSGRLVNAWNLPGCRHGTLSNPKYLEYLLSWCRRQIDAGADYLFMDEIDAALASDEGFDDYSIADFRRFLLERYAARGWTPADRRWQEALRVDLANRSIAADGTMASFQYREYLKALGLVADSHGPRNPLAADWHDFRIQRDDRAWKYLTGAIRNYAAARDRRVFVSGNGLARYVDLQVLGVWEHWRTRNGRIDLAESQIDEWASTVAAGRGLAGRPVPVVFFHDWGFNFPWLDVPAADRRLWMRVRGAEIYAAGGMFAFPVQGPFGNDSSRDGTLPEIVRQSRFYHRHEDLYLDAEVLGFEPLEADQPELSLALWRRGGPNLQQAKTGNVPQPALILHVINRRAAGGEPVARASVTVSLPVDRAPLAVRVVSPDWPGERAGEAAVRDGRLRVTLPHLSAYAVAILPYAALPAVRLAARRITPAWRWARGERSEFPVHRGGIVAEPWALPGLIQGKLHPDLRNPPTFLVNMPQGGALKIHVRGVASRGAKLVWLVDSRTVKTIDLPDRDGKDDALAAEYDETFALPIPPGRHRATLDNVGGDWACIGWYALAGETEEP
jgi:hypothetical protein